MHTGTCDTLICADRILTQNDRREELRQGAIAIRDGAIAEIGPASALHARWQPRECLELNHHLVMPGLVNHHTHAAMTVFRGLADDLPLMEWLNKHIWPLERQATSGMFHAGALLACAEMLRSGTTCFTDMYLAEEATARAVDDSGLRAVLGEGLFANPAQGPGHMERMWETVGELHAVYGAHPRIRTAIAPHSIYATTPELLRRSLKTAEQHDVVWTIHLAESRQETADCLKQFGCRPVEHLHRLGALAPRALLAHCVDLEPAEIALLAASGARVAHNPDSNLKLANGIAPVTALLRAGITIGLGTDGAASNNNLNLFQEMNTAALLQKTGGDPTATPAPAVLDMATRNAAACLRWPGLGSLVAGHLADLIALDLREPSLQPLHNAVSNVVYAAHGGEVTHAMVAGRLLYRDGQYLSFDYPALLTEIESIQAWCQAHRQ